MEALHKVVVRDLSAFVICNARGQCLY